MNTELTQLQSRYDRLRLLYEAANVLHSTIDPQQALELILKQAVDLMGASSGSVVLVNPTNQFLEIHAAYGLSAQAAQLKLRVGEGITGWVARHGKPARVGRVADDPRYFLLRPEVRSELAVPLEVQGEVRGVINVDSDREGAFTAEDQELLEALGGHAATVIHHTWQYEQLRLKARLYESLIRVSQILNSTLNLDDALSAITRETCVLMSAKVCSLRLLDDSREWLDLRACFGAGETYLNKRRLSVEESVLGVVVRRKKPLQLENVQTSTRYQNVEMARQEGLVSLVSVPLLVGGQVLGALNVYTAKPYSFSNEEIRILGALAELSATAIERARLYERVVDSEELLRQNEKLSALGLLAAEVAHEIRNPLTVIKMLYHSLDLHFEEGDPRGKDAQIIAAKIDHLNRFVEQILALSRTAEPVFAPVDLNQILNELNLLVRHKLKQQQVECVRTLTPDLRPVLGDSGQLEQAFLNLILNAAEAMPQGGTLNISTGLVQARRNAEAPTHAFIQFQDTGLGMNTDQKRKAFSSVLQTTKAKGTGLGLAIVGRIIETHHGRVKISSRSGKGTTIRVLLPLA